MANAITVARVLLVFLIIGVWGRERTLANMWVDLAMVPLLAWAIIMDAIDGWAARKLHEESKAGALFDIAGDRIVELALWTFFAIRRDTDGHPLIPLWVPLVIITRTVLTDLIRSVAFGEGKTAFGADGMQSSAWARQLVSSRWSRAAYGAMKAVAWCALGVLIAWPSMGMSAGAGVVVRLSVDILVYLTTLFAVVRAVPVLWEGRRYVFNLKRVDAGSHRASGPAGKRARPSRPRPAADRRG